jgi:hypothetical protein
MRCGVGGGCSRAGQAAIAWIASARLTNQFVFRHSSRNFPLKLSTKAFCTGLPGWMKRSSTPQRYAHR